jgi:hypothetical protein
VNKSFVGVDVGIEVGRLNDEDNIIMKRMILYNGMIEKIFTFLPITAIQIIGRTFILVLKTIVLLLDFIF